VPLASNSGKDGADDRMIRASTLSSELVDLGRDVSTVVNLALKKNHGKGPILRVIAESMLTADTHLLPRYRKILARSQHDKLLRWGSSLVEMDPRHMLHDLFRTGAHHSSSSIVKHLPESPGSEQGLSCEASNMFFTVWRPCSREALRLMMTGKATGKGLNVKGKSAKRGKLSGFVPYLQISSEEHKPLVPAPPTDSRMRIFFPSEQSRDGARSSFESIRDEMERAVDDALVSLEGEKTPTGSDEMIEQLHLLQRWAMDDSTIATIDDSGFGLELPERLFVEAVIARRDISHPEGWETGRPSEPDYMDLNMRSLRHTMEGQPKVVVLQMDDGEPLFPCASRAACPRPS
jgi:hypothetical protein